ncbi:MAG: hypothetical protein LUC91_04040 [Prevotella sp.]|nr:hypothetical protein [Prevotella sp.]
MKRLFLIVVAVLSITMTFAENEELNSVENAKSYDMSVNYDMLADYLELTSEQLEEVKDIHTSFCADMLNATEETGEERDSIIKNAVNKDLTNMSYVLDMAQYYMYKQLLNNTFNNRELEK